MALLFILLIFAIIIAFLFFYMRLLLWMLFSPDYVLAIGFAGIFTMDHMAWLTSSETAHFIWAVVAMVIVGFTYHKLNNLLYSASRRIYAIVSFPIVVISSLFLMLTVVLMFLEEFAPNLADDPTIKHAIYIVLALIIAVFAWRKRQTTMAQLHSPTNIVLTNGNVMVVESSTTPMSPYTPSAASYTPPASPYSPPATPPTSAPGAFPPPPGKGGFKNY
nr:hypothetical protein [Bifidobacterium dentium]